MAAEDFYINSFVIVRGNQAWRDGEKFFEKDGTDSGAFIKDLYRQLDINYPRFFKMDNLCKLAFTAAELLLKDRPLDFPADEIALVFSNATASLDTDEAYYKAVADKSNYFPSPAVFVYTLPNILMGEICIRNHFLGENTFFVSGSFDAALLSEYCRTLLASGKAKCCIMGWVEVKGDVWEAVLFLAARQAPKESVSRRLTKESLNEIYALKRK